MLTGLFCPWQCLVTGPLPAPASAPQVDVSQLTAQERADLLSRLSDEQVRELMLRYMRDQAGESSEPAPVIDEIHQKISLFRENFGERLSHNSIQWHWVAGRGSGPVPKSLKTL